MSDHFTVYILRYVLHAARYDGGDVSYAILAKQSRKLRCEPSCNATQNHYVTAISPYLQRYIFTCTQVIDEVSLSYQRVYDTQGCGAHYDDEKRDAEYNDIGYYSV